MAVRAHHALWAASIAAVALCSLAARVFFFGDPQRPHDWSRAVQKLYVELGASPSSHVGILVTPWWTEEPLPLLEDVGHLVLRQKALLQEDIQGLRVLWVVSASDRLAESKARLPFSTRPKSIHKFGTVTLLAFDVPVSMQASYWFREALPGAKVTRTSWSNGKEEVSACAVWNEKKQAWYCGHDDPKVFVGKELRVYSPDPHKCIWANPPRHGKSWRIVFPKVLLSNKLRFRAGVTFRGARLNSTGGVNMRVLLGNKEILQRTLSADKIMWHAFDINTSSYSKMAQDVTVEIWSDLSKGRWFCFDGFVWPDS